jgi:hypothetical protein
MAKRIVKWTLDNSILKLSKHLEDPKATAEILAEFDLNELFTILTKTPELKEQFLAFTAKQKLMDVGASEVGNADGKVTAAKKKWAELLEGKWTGERVNATGKAENQRILGEVKAASQTVSLQGLMMKKLAFPATFTEADEAKLQEFMEIAVAAGKKGKGK